MSTVRAQINHALAGHNARRGRPVALCLGEGKLTPPPRADLSTAAGRPRAYRHLASNCCATK
ncbi:hypothetical protein [Hymenobacter terricola]|uniref:hypothetical protein n=1 Tax=Hymenobacter terricola TaxID=2819236 RepID=UPI001B30C938|nr:hypothetical protein [Hymenobacter terricola]